MLVRHDLYTGRTHSVVQGRVYKGTSVVELDSVAELAASHPCMSLRRLLAWATDLAQEPHVFPKLD